MIQDVIKLDLHKQDSYPSIFAKQYDTLERRVIIELYDNDIAYTIDGTAGTDYIIMLRYTKPDGKQGLLEYTVQDNTISTELTEQVLCQKGRVVCDVAIYRNKDSDGTSVNTLLSSSLFYIFVEKSAFDEEKVISSNEYLALTKATNECINVTNECKVIVSEYKNKLRPEMMSLIEQMKNYLSSINTETT